MKIILLTAAVYALYIIFVEKKRPPMPGIYRFHYHITEWEKVLH